MMALSTKLEDKLEGIENYRAWKYRIGLILKENDLEKYIKDKIPEPKEAEAKEKHKKDMIMAQRIIADSIKDHLIPQVSSKKTPKEMYDALSRMYEGRNINKKMNLRFVDVFVTSKCIHLYIVCIVPRCLFWEVSIM